MEGYGFKYIKGQGIITRVSTEYRAICLSNYSKNLIQLDDARNHFPKFIDYRVLPNGEHRVVTTTLPGKQLWLLDVDNIQMIDILFRVLNACESYDKLGIHIHEADEGNIIVEPNTMSIGFVNTNREVDEDYEDYAEPFNNIYAYYQRRFPYISEQIEPDIHFIKSYNQLRSILMKTKVFLHSIVDMPLVVGNIKFTDALLCEKFRTSKNNFALFNDLCETFDMSCDFVTMSITAKEPVYGLFNFGIPI